ncbi:amidohydrolase [Priestia koreensis]|uniref:Amidohydrolase n=2 Tax=Priestia koreensis TaxID=284581 RepID=A0A0M0LH64_9BACI|nr:amidohydrolase [Priestia koreensis]
MKKEATYFMLHFINVHLPLEDRSSLYEVIIQEGKYESIKKQDDYREEDTFIPLKGEHVGKTRKIDCEGRVMLPGLVDMHMHLDKAYSFSSVPNESGTLEEAIHNYDKLTPTFTSEILRQRMIKASLEALSYGTTTIRTHIDFSFTLPEEVAFRGLETALEVKEELKEFMDIEVAPMFSGIDVNDESHFERMRKAIELGIDAIGGAPHLAKEPEKEIELLFLMAKTYDKPLDLHTDESDDPDRDTVISIAEQTVKSDMKGRVVVDHLCSLAAMTEDKAHRVIELMKEADLGVVTLPAVNMYLQGRGDEGIVRRGTTRIRELKAEGIRVATASDNIHDPFHPFGKADLIQIGLMTAYVAHMGTRGEQHDLLKMMTHVPASILGLRQYGIKEGHPANFVIFNAQSVEGVFTDIPSTRYVFNRHRWVSVTETSKRLATHSMTELWRANQFQI